MSECMTIAEEKYPDEELTAKDIVRSILSEALHSVVVNADKDSSHIGDCKEHNPVVPGSESCEGKQEEGKPKELRVIKDQALADSELRIQNGKIHLQANGAKAVVNLSNLTEEVNYSRNCVVGGSDKKVESSSENVLVVKSGQEKPEERSREDGKECGERPFTPFTTEDLRKSILQVWKNVNSPVLNGWDGELVNQPQEVVRLMEDLATIRVTADPNRPRACAFLEEDVKKMINEMEGMGIKPNVDVTEGGGKEEEEERREGEPEVGGQIPDVASEECGVTLYPVESDEESIESSESVIQVIEPQDDSNDEDEGRITFSLLETPECEGEEEEVPRYRSGMTTVGPIKGGDHDPKMLTGPEVDYGRMTRITGSRELKKDSSRKIILDDGEDTPVIYFVESDTIVNHDIASLTKMQKVKEVLSDQPKSDEDLRSEEKLMRSPLDLKDVDADSCDSYNVIDIGIPLLTVEETNLNTQGKDIVQAILTDSSWKTPEEDKTTPSFSCNKSVTQLTTNQKHNTISRVFQKASNRFAMKDSDSFLRNSRSLPRDTSKITNTESFRSLLDDCQTSAATVLKKSRSLLRNTQNALKAVSRTGFGHVVSGDKQVYAADIARTESSTSSKKSELLKLKDTIKNKVGKTLKSFEENQKKPSPKSPLVCANQFPQARENRKVECEGVTDSRGVETDEDDGTDKEIEVICGVKFQGGNTETVRSEPETADDPNERPKSAAGVEEPGKIPDAKKSLTLPVDATEEEYIGGDVAGGKLRRKNKKLSARIRSFWQTAFGKVKATTQKKDVS